MTWILNIGFNTNRFQYFLAFGEYLFLRLTSILLPDNIVYTRTCSKHQGEVIVRGFWHYLSTLICFTSVGVIQLICFFLLTISRRFMHFRRKYKNFISMEEKLQCELVVHIKTVMYRTAIPAFRKSILVLMCIYRYSSFQWSTL